MEAFLVSTGIVTLAEMGDKTQLLSLMLAAKLRRPVPIILGILAATLLNHALAGAVGAWVTSVLGQHTLSWLLGITFLLMAIWIMIPDKLDEQEAQITLSAYGIFATVLVVFFMAEMGDKTQIATVALAAQYSSLVWVVVGTTLGMMLANVPAVLMGNRFANRLPLKWVHGIAAAIFAVLGIATLLSIK